MRIYLNRAATLLVLAFSSLGLVAPGLSNVCLFLLVLCGIAALSLRDPESDNARPVVSRRALRQISVALALPALAIGIHQIGSGDFGLRDYDRPLRLAVFVLVFFAVRRVSSRSFEWLPWAWMTAIFLCFAKAWMITGGGSLPNSGSLGFMAGIAFSNMTMLLATWLLLSLKLATTSVDRVLRIAAAVVAIGVTFLVKTRGTWLVLPFYAIFFICYLHQIRAWQKLAILILPVLLIGGGMLGSSMVRERIYDVQKDLVAYADGSDRDTSVGQRLEVWRASWMMYREHPWAGVGRNHFKSELRRLADEGRITRSIVELPHSHNGMLFQMALWGTGGLIALLLAYVVPLFWFCRDLSHQDDRVRTYAATGATMCIGFWVFDLTDVMFFWVILNGFYTINLAIFLRSIEQCKREWERSALSTLAAAGNPSR